MLRGQCLENPCLKGPRASDRQPRLGLSHKPPGPNRVFPHPAMPWRRDSGTYGRTSESPCAIAQVLVLCLLLRGLSPAPPVALPGTQRPPCRPLPRAQLLKLERGHVASSPGVAPQFPRTCFRAGWGWGWEPRCCLLLRTLVSGSGTGTVLQSTECAHTCTVYSRRDTLTHAPSHTHRPTASHTATHHTHTRCHALLHLDTLSHTVARTLRPCLVPALLSGWAALPR